MARRRNKHTRPVRPLNTALGSTRATTRHGSFLVRQVSADRAIKAYVCPGCGNQIPPGTGHVVAWPEDPGLTGQPGLDERRHWHNHCWRLQR